MNKFLLLIIPAVILTIVAIIFLGRGSGQKGHKPPILFYSPSPTITPQQLPAEPLFINKVVPDDGANNIPQDQQIQIIFSRSLILDEIYVAFGPGVRFETTVSKNIVTLIPKSPLISGLNYTLLVKFNKTGQISKQYLFTVAGAPPATLPDTQPMGAAQQTEEYNRRNQPDLFLANKSPLKQGSFDLYRGTLKLAPNNHYAFVLVEKSDQAQTDLSKTLISLGLTEQQISSLDIKTISSDQFNKVLALRDKFPYYSYNVAMSYDVSFDTTTIYYDKKNSAAGEQQLNDFLNQNGIESIDWINNLSIVYQ